MTAPPDPPPATPPRRPRGTRWLFAVVAVAAGLALFWPQGDGSRRAPGGHLVDGGGRAVPLGSRLAPVTLVHFWSTWCPPCIDEIPTLVRLGRDMAGEERFRIVLVAVDDTTDQVQRFLGGPEVDDVLYDPSWEVAHRFGTRKLPETHLVVGGRVTETIEGATDWGRPDVRERISAALDGRDSAPGADR